MNSNPMDQPIGEPQAPKGAFANTGAGAAGIENGVLVPLIQASTTGAALAIAITLAVNSLTDHHLDTRHTLLLMSLIVAATWCLLLADVRRLLWGLEILLNRDVNHDGTTGPPTTVERIVAIRPRGATLPDDHTPATIDTAVLARFVADAARLGTSYRNLRRYARPDWETMRDHLIDAGWARWKSTDARGNPNVNQGWELTAPLDPDTIIDHISVLQEPPTPLPSRVSRAMRGRTAAHERTTRAQKGY